MARLFVEPAKLADEVVVLTDEDHRYLTRVLRLAVGETVTLFDGTSVEASARITRVGPRALELKIEERRPVAAIDRPHVTVIQALAKGDKLDLVVQKATELGAGAHHPGDDRARGGAARRRRPAHAVAAYALAEDRARGGAAVGSSRRAGGRRA